MKGLETGKDKVKKICDVLKRETLEPAKHEADEIVASARRHADEILADAHKEAKKMAEDAYIEIEKQKSIFQASITQACRQTLEALKEKIEQKLFNPELARLVTKPMQDPKLMAQLINAIVHALEKEGTKSDLSVVISSAISAKAVNELLASEVIQRLKEKGVLLSSLGGGIEVKLLNNNITIDLSDETIRELVATYIRKDFREFLFGK
ncbi:MAG TPA: V-type ATP synthase subunit E family protein [Rhabdochlamydiaceae bacterium]|jgi:V/A-type H+-transporting ATPase subunit E|nr:V-type ATP synthase subunit E family protein [Rhabdochlamydiaceae bacterium]